MSSLVESLRHLLKYADLSDNAILVYSALAGLKPRTLGEIVSLTGLSHDDAERAIKDLIVAKLVREIPGRPTLYEALPPYALLKRQLEDFTGSIQEFEKSLTGNLEKSIGLLRDGLNRFGSEISKTFEDVIIKIAGSLEEILGEIVVNNIVNVLEEVMKNVLNIASENAKKKFMELKDSVVAEFKSSVEESMKNFSENIKKATNDLVSEINKLLYEQTKQQINDIVSKFELGLKAIDALVIKGFEKEVPRTMEIQILKGVEKLKGQANDIAKRAQNFIIIVAPTYDYISFDIINSLPPRVRVQIVAGFYPKHNDMVNALKKRGPTTQLRDMKGIEMFAVVADMKEALLCALPPTVVNPDDVIGIFTNDPAWVSMIQSQLSHIFMGASRL
ncbi:MAG: helix-turn-helix domain-containing protein [Candidatus Njordarchaeota archaeon]